MCVHIHSLNLTYDLCLCDECRCALPAVLPSSLFDPSSHDIHPKNVNCDLSYDLTTQNIPSMPCGFVCYTIRISYSCCEVCLRFYVERVGEARQGYVINEGGAPLAGLDTPLLPSAKYCPVALSYQ